MEFLENQYVKQRIKKSTELFNQGINPYSNKCKKSLSNQAFLDKYCFLLQAEHEVSPDSKEFLAGRIRFIRLMGKAAFIKIEDDSGIVQIYLSSNDLGDYFAIFKKYIEVGDIVAVEGFPFVTKTGELTMHAQNLELLTKSIVPLPEKYHGLVDIQARYRQRYLDCIMNSDVKKIFKTRSQIISAMRHFFEQKGFLEVETPMMHPIPGGANAKPFVTHHNALNVDRYLRIAPELYLKRLIVGGFEAIFEINRNFRNEGMDYSHNPEFTMTEFYWAYKRYNDLIELTKELFDFIIKTLHISPTLKGDKGIIDITNFRTITYKDALIDIGKIPKDIIEDVDKLYEYLISNGIQLQPQIKQEIGKLQAEAFDAFVEDKLIQPTFVVEFPVAISPLARRNDVDKKIADRFELFIDGKEIANGFSELNDPLDQLERFKAQMRARELGDEEAHGMDEDYVHALSYGMPPTAGEGIGVDRLVMLLTEQHSIKDVILFPALRPQHEH